MSIARRFVLGMMCAAFLAFSNPSLLQADLPESDVKEVNKYQFTEKSIAQFGAATRNLVVVVQKNPEIVKQASRENVGTKGLSVLVEFFNNIPDVKKAIQDSGMTMREYWTFEFAMLYAAAGNVALKAGGKLPDEYSRYNVEFFRTHEADFMKLEKDFKTLDALTEPVSSDEDEETEDEQ